MSNMSALCMALLATMLIGWASALPLTRIQRDDIDNLIEEEEEDEDPEIKEYFEQAALILQRARGVPSNETGARVAKYNPETDPWNPEELGSYYEGDILWPVNDTDGRNGLLATTSRWPNGVIPYKIATGFNLGSLSMINKAFQHYKDNVPCIKFVKQTTQKDYIYITKQNTGCWSYVGRIGGAQTVNLQDPGCTGSLGTPAHELMHAAGFFHEQSRFDRDDNVIIKLENVIAGYESNFDKVGAGTTTSYSVPYTYSSVMHYSSTAFSKNGLPTIVAKPNATVTMGQRVGLDPNDIKKLRAMYGCPVTVVP